MKVIINADDFGYDENCTSAILEAFDLGCVTTTTAMVTHPWFERGMDIARNKGLIKKVGLHFNLTQGQPLTEEMKNCRFFCDTKGFFTGNFHRSLKTRIVIPQDAIRPLRSECEAQCSRFLDCGGKLLHLDSHHHIHTDYAVARVLFPIAQRYGFRSARLSCTHGPSFTMSKRIYKGLFNAYLRRNIGATADAFTGFDGFVANLSTFNPRSVVEVMVHPEYKIDNVRALEGVLVDEFRPMREELEFWNKNREGVELTDYE